MARRNMDLTDERQSPYRVILYLAWPLFLEQILATLVNFVDTAMVGSLGAAATASVSISNSFVLLINGVVMALGIGITAYVARSVGAKDYDAAKAYIRHALVLLVLVGVPVALTLIALHRKIPMWMGAGPEFLALAQDYLLITSIFRIFSMTMMMIGSVLRGRGDTKTPMRVNVVVNLLNVVGNYLLIHGNHTIHLNIPFLNIEWAIPMIGAGMGVNGAALSTGISWFLGGMTLVIMLFVKKDPTRISVKESFKPDFKLIRRIVDLSIPAMLERLCMSGSDMVVIKTVASLGTVSMAASTVSSTAEALAYMPAFAFATALTTLVGQSLGAKKTDLAKKYVRKTVGLGAAVMTVAGICLYVFSRQLAGFINSDPEVVELAAKCLRIVSFAQPLYLIAWSLAGALRGAGDTRWPSYIAVAGNWIIRALGAVICVKVFHFGMPMTALCCCSDHAIRGFFIFLRYRTGKWTTIMEEKKKREAAKAAA